MPVWLVGLGLKLSGVKAALAKVPAAIWYALAAVALLFGGVLYHRHEVRKHDTALEKAVRGDEDQKLAAMALKLKAAADKLSASVSAAERKKNDEANTRINAAAADLGVRGPGKASCGGPVIPAAAGRPVPASRPGNAAVAQVPDAGGLSLIGLPFNDAIDFGKDHDLDRAEVIAWRDWYAKMVAAWPKP